ncbi:alpha-ketoglutarate-dependent dioxygenase alkB homolog 7, mitochondrial-like isoform X2 [Centruroides sculpturatus]|nr:alpha-ketoglutarate-dependent dioxygenase alkB homolog 7, mitochondrial-like isoform X2 [Centruroides sculpturatus]
MLFTFSKLLSCNSRILGKYLINDKTQNCMKLCCIAPEKLSTTTSCLDCSDEGTLKLIQDDFKIYNEFLSEEEEKSLVEEAEKHLKRLRYQYDHWDDAIHGYRETEQKHWKEKNKIILQRVRELAFCPNTNHINQVHILDLEKTGYIKPHIDSVRFCGNTIAGLSLLSDCVMRLVHEDNPTSRLDALLKRRSLYVMT